ncbi:hypothetical protein ACRQ4C_01440 [Curtobacterium sp. SP.BCp]|uniref:hypothetical protein n=1 Tax=Curtobacterium sp. SP.BCp TaxID=3435230 RepID=UPI003F73AAA0
MHQLDTAPTPAARHVSTPVRVVLPEVQQARRGRLLVEASLVMGVVAVPTFFAALIWWAVQA